MLLFACDIEGTQHDQKVAGPPIVVLGTNVSGADAVIPADGVLQIAFDRYLLPATITRQSYVVVDNLNQVSPNLALRTLYDPIARTVTITGPDGPGKAWLTPGQVYKLALLVPDNPASDLGGFRAIDRAPLDARQKRQFTFRAGPPAEEDEFEPAVDFCDDVLPVFAMKCGGSLCHGSSRTAASGLVLDAPDGVRAAVGRVALGSSTAPRAATPEPTPSIFGVNMPLVAPGDPGSSWLLYKVELPRLPTADAGPKPPVRCTPPGAAPPLPAALFTPLAPARAQADAIERGILDDLILGREMPYPSLPSAYVPPPPTPAYPHPTAYAYTPLDFQERERLRIWITNGAAVPECGPCTLEVEGDAGAP